MKKIRKNFAADNNGGVALIVGITLVLVIFGIMSLVIDLNRTQTSYTKNQDATDAAALATSEFVLRGIIDQLGTNPDPFSWSPTTDELKSYADRIVRQNFQVSQTSAIYDPNSLSVSYTKTPAPNGVGNNYKITVAACADLTDKIAKEAKHASTTRTCTSSDAGFTLTTDKKVEVGLALDYTNSMYCKGAVNCQVDAGAANRESYALSKAFKLNDTLNYIFDTYFAGEGQTPLGIYASVIPFTSVVNLYPYNTGFITPQASPPTLPAPTSYTSASYFHDYRDAPDLVGATYDQEYINFNNSFAYAFNRIPAIDSAAKLSQITSSSSPTSFLPMQSFRATYDAITQNDTYKVGYCYNGAVDLALDQRAEKKEYQSGYTATNQIGLNGEVMPVATTVKINGATTEESHDIPRKILLRESFPVQPLTNHRQVLKDTVGRFVSNGTGQRLFNNITYSDDLIDSQSSRLNKTYDFSGVTGTSSIHGLLWAWLTINNSLTGSWWSAPSLMEDYIGGSVKNASVASRTNLPSNQNLKHIILITDGNDNDGLNNSGYTNACDGYSPAASITDDQYVALCDRIKQDDVVIHTILFDFTPPVSGTNKYQRCASPGEYYENVSPTNLRTVMDKIFRDILTDLITVKLVR